MRIIVILTVAIISTIGSVLSGQPKSIFKIVPNGNLDAENGLFFEESNRIHLYSHLPMALNPKTNKYEMTPLGDDLMTHWKGQPYYHETYDIRDGSWVMISRNFSDGPDRYLDFGPCDPMNQIDLSPQHEEIKALLPPSSMLKAVADFYGATHYFTVVYSDSPDARVRYSLKVALIVSVGKSFVPDRKTLLIQGTQDLGDNGQFCGTRILSDIKLSDGQTASDLLVYRDTPGGSSHYINVRSYLVKKVAGSL